MKQNSLKFLENLLLNISASGDIDSSIYDLSKIFPELLFGFQSQCVKYNKYYHTSFFNIDDELLDDFEKFKLVNPFPRAATYATFDKVASSKQLLDQDMIERNEFYQNVCRPRNQLDHGYGIMLHRQGSDAAFISVMVPKDYPAEDEARLLEVLEQVRPHFQNAFQMLLSLNRRRADTGTRSYWLDRIPTAAFVLDKHLHVLEMNINAEHFLDRSSTLKIEKGALLSGNSGSVNTDLERLVGAALGQKGPAAPMTIKTNSGFAIFLEASAIPPPADVPPSLFEFLKHPQHVLLIAFDPSEEAVLDIELLSSTLGLTEREAMLTGELINGLTLRESADRLEMSYNTARKHIANATGRGGLRSQADLIRLGTSILARHSAATDTVDPI